MRTTLLVGAYLLCCLAALEAAEKSVSGKVVAVEASKNSITVGELVLDVTRKTKITVDGKAGTLADIQKGQSAKVTYDDGLEVAISIIVGKEPAADLEANATATKALQGEWLCVAEERGGKPTEKAELKKQNRRLSIKGNSLAITRVSGQALGTYSGKFELDANNRTIDWVGKAPKGGYMEWIGIYELDGDTLKLCYRYNTDGKAVRPKKFETDTERPNASVFETFKRDTD